MDARIDRRRLLKGLGLFSGLVPFATRPSAAGFFATPIFPDGKRTLLLVQLSGGNDGLDTVVPYADDAYFAARPTLGLEKSSLLRFDEYRAWNPRLQQLSKAYKAGKLAVVEGIGYPSPNLSHFESLDIWHAADHSGRSAGAGWIGKLCDAAWPKDVNPNLVVHIGPNVPFSLYSETHHASSFIDPSTYRWLGGEEDVKTYRGFGEMDMREGAKAADSADSPEKLDFLRRSIVAAQDSSTEILRAVAAHETKVAYPDTKLARAMRNAAALISGDVGSRVVSVELDDFDTHSNQRERHDDRMTILDGALGALLQDLEASEQGRQTVVMVFSEFGRRLAENGARGTDHGTAGPMFVLGHDIKGGLHGKHPSLAELDNGNLIHTTDFRSVYAGLIEGCFDIPHARVLGKEYPLVKTV